MLQQQVAIVTGATSGIGRVIALALAKEGARIFVVSNEPQKIPETLAEIRQLSPESEAREVDVTSAAAVEEAIKAVQERYGRIDILVNNAGITQDNLLLRMGEEHWDRVMEVNLKSVYRLTRLVLRPMMKARYGRIVNISSVVALTGNPGQANYSASKAALLGFTKSVALEVASRQITANCVAPGFIETAMTAKLSPEVKQAMLSRIPLGTMGKPEDVAAAVLFLVSEAGRYVTGETLHVNGGMYMS
ncbi:MAG: 3-oxoacyl-[acyl-carrier-protein] reductase [Magnetococcales bacterium]|nr:3-oxoacyl-[acyl-carrier-protein] reductase [Magnetococcales bacterium]MBF0155983.1 3-oxoacyl-[acyl-carrier-protein] reductase [Magnetococcales bacterium]